jgi:hypothetical protein
MLSTHLLTGSDSNLLIFGFAQSMAIQSMAFLTLSTLPPQMAYTLAAA